MSNKLNDISIEDILNFTFNEDEDEDESDYPWYDAVCNWVDRTRHLHATVKTIMDMPVNGTRTFACFDRDVFDIIGGDLDLLYKTEDSVLPSEILNCNYHVQYTKQSGNTNEFGTGCYILAFNKEEIDNPRNNPQIENNLYVEYIPDKWKMLRHDNEISMYPPNTRVGWRGPMIPLEILDDIMIKFK